MASIEYKVGCTFCSKTDGINKISLWTNSNNYYLDGIENIEKEDTNTKDSIRIDICETLKDVYYDNNIKCEFCGNTDCFDFFELRLDNVRLEPYNNLSMKSIVNDNSLVSLLFMSCKMTGFIFNNEKKSFEMDKSEENEWLSTQLFTSDFSFDNNIAYLRKGAAESPEYMSDVFKFSIDDIIYDDLGNIRKATGNINQVISWGEQEVKDLINPVFRYYFNTSEPLPPLRIENTPFAILEIEGATIDGVKKLHQYIFNSFHGVSKVLKTTDNPELLSKWEGVFIKEFKPR